MDAKTLSLLRELDSLSSDAPSAPTRATKEVAGHAAAVIRGWAGAADFGQFMAAQGKVEKARVAYNLSSCQLELEQIKCRMAELLSQAEPLNGMGLRAEREQVRQVVHFLINGRTVSNEG